MSSNPSLPHVLHLEPVQFISKIVHDIDTGWSFVPFIGSGLSRDSGIIMGMEFTNYLAYTTYLVLADPEETKKVVQKPNPNKRWDLLRDRWPDQPNEAQTEIARQWILRQFKELCKKLKLDVNYDSTNQDRIKSLTPLPLSRQSPDLLSDLDIPSIPAILASEESTTGDSSLSRFASLLKTRSIDKQAVLFNLTATITENAGSYQQTVIETGLRSLHDWRVTLSFLASVNHVSTRRAIELLPTPSAKVIDDFNFNITHGRAPNLGHKMLAQLATTLRTQLLITTNFDTLIEDAYKLFGLPLRTFAVQKNGSLYDPGIVAEQASLIKLHGDTKDTRADLSLDDQPHERDLQIFAEYLSPAVFAMRAKNNSGVQKHLESKRLLVIGYSGRDHRCTQMIRYWLESTSPGEDRPTVYWICVSDRDVIRVRNLFAAPQYAGQVRITQTPRPDLLLYQLYHRVNIALPTGAASHEDSHMVPPRQIVNYFNSSTDIESTKRCASEKGSIVEAARLVIGHERGRYDAALLALDTMVNILQEKLTEILANPHWTCDDKQQTAPAPLDYLPQIYALKFPEWANELQLSANKSNAFAVDCKIGATRAASIAVDKVSSEQALRVFWLETKDYMDADAMLRDFLRMLALRLRSYSDDKTILHPLSKPIPKLDESKADKTAILDLSAHFIDVLNKYRVEASKTRIIIYGRDGYGTCSGLIDEEWGQDQHGSLYTLIYAFVLAGIQVLYFHGDESRESLTKAFNLYQKATSPIPTASPSSITVKKSSTHIDPFRSRETSDDGETTRSQTDHDLFVNIEDVLLNNQIERSRTANLERQRALHDTRSNEIRGGVTDHASARLCFFYGMSLFRHSCHPHAIGNLASACVTRGYYLNAPDCDYLGVEEALFWITPLRNVGLVFDKPGGRIWMHKKSWKKLRESIEQRGTSSGDVFFLEDAEKIRSSLHLIIADWFVQSFLASGFVGAVIEFSYHYLCVIRHAERAVPLNRSIKQSNKDLVVFRKQLVCSALLEFLKALYASRDRVIFWQSASVAVEWVSEGHWEKTISNVGHGKEEARDTQRENGATKEPNKDAIGVIEAVRQVFGDKRKFPMELLSAIGSVLSGIDSASISEGAGEVRVHNGLTIDNSAVESIGAAKPQEVSLMPIEWRHISRLDEENASSNSYAKLLEVVFGNSPQARRLTDDFKSLLRGLSDVPSEGKSKAAETLERLVRRAVGERCQSSIRSVIVCKELSFLVLRRAKLEFHANDQIAKRRWGTCLILCDFGLRLCRFLPPFHWRQDYRLRVEILCTKSVALANLGRFFEANRCLSEAECLIHRVLPKSELRGLVELRRAEVRLTECFFVRLVIDSVLELRRRNAATKRAPIKAANTNPFFEVDKSTFFVCIDTDTSSESWNSIAVERLTEEAENHANKSKMNWFFMPPRIAECLRMGDRAESESARKLRNLCRLYGGLVDEATGFLDSAAALLTETSQSDFLWSRLHVLRLRTLACAKQWSLKVMRVDEEFIMSDGALSARLATRRRGSLSAKELRDKGLALSRHDPIRRFRTLKYYFEAVKDELTADEIAAELKEIELLMGINRFFKETKQKVNDLLWKAWTSWKKKESTSWKKRIAKKDTRPVGK